jgi:formylglycine-generating enzyme required for sulfatase activity
MQFLAVFAAARSAEDKNYLDNYSIDDIAAVLDYMGLHPKMVYIPAGTFMMGSPSGEPGQYINETRYQVTLTKSFYIGKYPVTQAQYKAVMGRGVLQQQALFTDFMRDYGIGDNYPMYYVSWYDALVFCNLLSIAEGLSPAYSIEGRTEPRDWNSIPTVDNSALWNTVQIVAGSNGYRLPTEAQWEYACRAGTTTAFNWGINYINYTQANYRANSIVDNNRTAGPYLAWTTLVGSYAPNAWGLYDMHGNVREKCWDWYTSTPGSAAKTDPTGAVSGNTRVLKGGSWKDDASRVRSAYRTGSAPGWRMGEDAGFRLVRPE